MPMWDGEISYLAWPHATGETPHDGAPRSPAIVFVHANGFNAETYRSIIGPLTVHATVLAPDLRGHGLTTLKAEPSTHPGWTVFAGDLVRFLDGLDGRPKLLVGHSMGATAALIAAAERPDLVSGVVLVEPVVFEGARRAVVAAARRAGLFDRLFPIARAAERRRALFPSRTAMLDSYRGRGAFRFFDTTMLADYVAGGSIELETGEVRLACDPAWEAANFRMGPPPVRAALRSLRRPAVLLHGTVADGVGRSTCPPAMAALMKRAQRGLEVLTVKDAGHFLPMEHPSLVRDAVVRMLQRRSASAQA